MFEDRKRMVKEDNNAAVVEGCSHKMITITVKTEYALPNGYRGLMEQEHIDMSDYETGNVDSYTTCSDCGRVLDDQC